MTDEIEKSSMKAGVPIRRNAKNTFRMEGEDICILTQNECVYNGIGDVSDCRKCNVPTAIGLLEIRKFLKNEKKEETKE